MNLHYQISLQHIVDLFTKKDGQNITFQIDHYNVTLNDVRPFIYDEKFLTKEHKTNYECVIYNIILYIYNPENFHNGSIVIEKDEHKNLYISKGLEIVIAALYHEKNVITVSSFSKLNTPFEYVELENNHQTQQLVFLNEHFNYEFSDKMKNSYINLLDTWHNKQYVIEQVKKNNLDIKDYISKDMLDDKSFILELININYQLIDYFYDFLSVEFQSTIRYIFENLEENDKSRFAKYLGSNLHHYITYFTKNNYQKKTTNFTHQQQQVIDFIMQEDLLLFIVGNSEIPRQFNTIFYNFIEIIPSYFWENEKFVFQVLKNFSSKMLSKIHPSFFEKVHNMVFLFNIIGGNWPDKKDSVYQYIQDFFITNTYSYKFWFNNKNLCLQILKGYNTVDKINKYFHYEFCIAKIIYDNLHSTLKEDADILYELVVTSPAIFTLFKKKIQKEEKLILYYLQNVKYLSDDLLINKKYIFTLKDPELIKKILRSYPELLLDSKCPLKWKHDVNNYNYSAMNYFNKLPKKIQSILCANEAFIKSHLEKQSRLYYYLPLHLKTKKEMILLAAKDIHFDTSSIPISVLLNKCFCQEILSINIKVLKNIPTIIKYSVDFILFTYKIVNDAVKNNPNNGLYNLVNDYYPEIKVLLTYYGINKKDTYNFLSNYFINQKKYILYKKLNIKHEHSPSNILYKEAIKKI